MMMIIKRLFLIVSVLTVFGTADAQDFFGGSKDVVKWTFGSAKSGDNEFELSFKAIINSEYYMYSMEKTEGPLPLEFNFDKPAGCELIGEVTADRKSKEKFDEGFDTNVKYYKDTVVFTQKVKISGNTTLKGTLSYQACSATECKPGNSDFSFALVASESVKAGANSAGETPASSEPASGNSLVMFFIAALLMGLLGTITPCVFPMIPMIVSFFMSGSNKKAVIVTKGLIFGLSVTMLYTFVGLIVALTQNESFAYILSTHWIPNILFFGLFIVFALSFFGMFEITLPSGLANKADKQVDKGGYLASFFLAVTLALVSFSCTGAFVGTLLVQSAQGGVALKPILGMFGFGLGLGSPFIVFSFMPALIKKLPKSGGWLNSVKVVFAFVIFALSFKFLDIVDNYFEWNMITRDFVIAVWIAVGVLTGLYLLGKIKLSHDSDLKHVGVFRLILAIAAFSFVFYLIPGLFGAPLSSVSAFMPAQEKQVFDLTTMQPAQSPSVQGKSASESRHMTLPKGVAGYFTTREGFAAAKAQNKPVLIDFKGHNCGNCKKMEKGILTDKRIIDILNDKFVVVALYVDDKTELPESEQVIASNGKTLKTVGEVNMDYEAKVFGLNAQPYFVITNSDGIAISKGTGYETNADKFLQWLAEAIKN